MPGKFTNYNKPWIDSEIQSQINTVVEVVTRILDDVQTIILTGGFGRGEGSVKYVGEGTVLPLKDYDFLVIVKKKPNEKSLNLLNQVIYAKLGLNNPEGHLFRFSGFAVDLWITTKWRLRLTPDITTYELKVASKLLYGEDVRKEIPWEAKDIPLASGWRLLFEKMTGLIGHLPIGYLRKGRIEEHNRELLIYECNKAFVEIATALCLLMGCYAPSFRLRKKLFKENFHRRLPELYEKLPNLPDLIEKATNFKFRPSFDDIRDDPMDLWFNTRNTLMTVSIFYLERFLHLKNIDFIAAQNSMIDMLRRKYFQAIADEIAKNSIGSCKDSIAYLLNLTLQTYYNYRYFLDVYRNYRHLPFQIFKPPPTAVTIQMHTVAPQVLLSIKENGRIEKKYFESAKNTLLYLSPYREIDSLENLRLAYLMTYKHLPAH